MIPQIKKPIYDIMKANDLFCWIQIHWHSNYLAWMVRTAIRSAIHYQFYLVSFVIHIQMIFHGLINSITPLRSMSLACIVERMFTLERIYKAT